MKRKNEHLFGGLTGEREKIWAMARNIAKAMDLGDWGADIGAADINLEYNTTCRELRVIPLLVDMYHATDRLEYIDLARSIANNYIKEMWNGKFFVRSNMKYVDFYNKNVHIFLLLEAVIRGMYGEVPEFSIGQSEYQDYGIVEDIGPFDYAIGPDRMFFDRTFPSVLVTDIEPDTNFVDITTGESYPLKLTFYPDDASSKSVTWYNSDPLVARISESHVITAYSTGSTVLTGISGDRKKTITVEVKVSPKTAEEE